MQFFPQISVVPHSEAVAADVDNVAVVEQSVDQRRGHHFIAEDVAPFLKALVTGQHRRRMFVAAAHELKEVHGPGARDRQVADLVDD